MSPFHSAADRLGVARWEADRHLTAMGERLVPATLSLLAEPHEAWPMRDKIDRLERLGFLDAQQWLVWRDLRNRLSHEYPDRPDLRWAAVEAAIGASAELASCYRAWRSRLGSRPAA